MTQLSAKQQYLYRLYLTAPPVGSTGGGLVAAYNLGFNHPDRFPRYHRTSLCFATWLAGRKHAKMSR